MKTVSVSIACTIAFLTRDNCVKFNKPFGTIEVMSEGYRVAFCENEDEAISVCRGMVGSDLTTTVSISNEYEA